MQDSVIQWPLGLGSKDLVGAGITAVVARLDAVVKFCDSSQLPLLEREKLVYQRLGHDHSGIVRYFGALENAVILQFASQTSIRQYVARQKKQVPIALKLRWVEQIFDAVQFVHSRNVLHGDISCNNIFLDDSLDVKLGDFAGSAIDDLPPLICYETSHELPDEDISTMTELFALGSTIFEVMTGAKPYKDLAEHEISAAFSEGRYPDLRNVSVFRSTIARCWSQDYATVDEALKDVKSEAKVFHNLTDLFEADVAGLCQALYALTSSGGVDAYEDLMWPFPQVVAVEKVRYQHIVSGLLCKEKLLLYVCTESFQDDINDV